MKGGGTPPPPPQQQQLKKVYDFRITIDGQAPQGVAGRGAEFWVPNVFVQSWQHALYTTV